jgi:hypothetical protein
MTHMHLLGVAQVHHQIRILPELDLHPDFKHRMPCNYADDADDDYNNEGLDAGEGV